MFRQVLSRFIDRCRSLANYQFPRLGKPGFRLVFKILPRKMDVQLLPKIWAELDFDEPVQQAAYWHGARVEKPTVPVLESRMKASPDSVFFDVGSNFGFYSFYFASRLPGHAIHSFEPNPGTFRLLKRIVDRNYLTTITPWEMGLGDETAKASLRLNEADSGQSTFGHHPDLEAESLPVHIDTFENWRKQAGLAFPAQPSWTVKMDVEGYELKALRGMKEALAARAFRGLAIELSDFNQKFCGSSVDEIVAFLREHGYVRLSTLRVEGRALPLQETNNGFFVPEGFVS